MLAAGCLLPSLLAGVLAPAAMDCHCVEQPRFFSSVGESWISSGLSENGGTGKFLVQVTLKFSQPNQQKLLP